VLPNHLLRVAYKVCELQRQARPSPRGCARTYDGSGVGWRREWDSNSRPPFRFCKLQILKCQGCQECYPYRRTLHRLHRRLRLALSGPHAGFTLPFSESDGILRSRALAERTPALGLWGATRCPRQLDSARIIGTRVLSFTARSGIRHLVCNATLGLSDMGPGSWSSRVAFDVESPSSN
jgi:hypothetical protein